MEIEHQRVVEAIFDAIDDLNGLLPKEQRLEKSLGTVLYGSSGRLDSLAFVNLVVAVEQKIQQEFGHAISLTDGESISPENMPIGTIEALANYVALLLRRKVSARAET